MVKKAKSKKDKSLLLPRLIIVLGILLMIFSIFWKIDKGSLGFKNQPTPVREVNVESKKPFGLKISKAKISLNVEESQIINGNWEVSRDGVSHLNTSDVPGNDGNIVIYGHNKSNILGSLNSVKIGDEVIITTRDNENHAYRVKSIEVVSPSRVDVINPTENEVLTIYTCTGLLDSKRLVVKAEPV